MKRLLEKIGLKTEKPDTETTKTVDRHMVTLYDIEAVAAKLSKNQPFFTMKSGGVYAVETRKKRVDGKMVDVPTNFLRLDKKRGLAGKDRRRAIREERRRMRDAIRFKNAVQGS